MKICYAFCILLATNVFLQSTISESAVDFDVGYEVTLAVPAEYTKGFSGRAFLIRTEQTVPYFRAVVSVEAVDKKYGCSIDIFLGDVKVWSSGHFSRFYTTGKCVLELTRDGDLRLKGPNEVVGWRTGTSGQGVKRLTLLRTGNLVLVDDFNFIKWQSFNFPTDTMLWGQRLSPQTRLTSFPVDSTLFYSMEIQHDKITLYLNSGKSKYSYWEYRPKDGQKNITFVHLTSNGLGIFNGRRKFDEIQSNGPDPVRFLALDNRTGNARLYMYSNESGKFEASYQALESTCDLPLACRSYGICTLSGSCACIEGANCENEILEGRCGGKREAEIMVELRGVIGVLSSGTFKNGVGKEECGRVCLEDCSCVAAGFREEGRSGRNAGECFLYDVARGFKEVEKGGKGNAVYMVKVGSGSGKKSGLKKWVVVVVGVADGFIIFVVLGGVGYYVIWKRRRDLLI